MGSELCGFKSSYQQLESQLMQIKQVENFLQLYPLIKLKFRLDPTYIAIPHISSLIKNHNNVVFKLNKISPTKTEDNQILYGIIFQENFYFTSTPQNYCALFYQGQINQNAQKSGKGKAIFDNGDTYEGQWKHNSIQGEGIYTQKQNFAIYQGQFRNWKKQGKGKLIQNKDKKYIYQGQFKNNQFDGQGQIQFDDGSKYQGQYRKGLQQGYGVYQTKSMKYEGTWQSGFMQGSGKAIWYSSQGQIISTYTGQYLQGKKHGFGEYVVAKGKTLRGQWFEGKFVSGTNSCIV